MRKILTDAVGNSNSVSEDLLHPWIGRKFLTFYYPDGSEQAAGLRIDHLEWLVLNRLVQMTIELMIRVNCSPSLGTMW